MQKLWSIKRSPLLSALSSPSRRFPFLAMPAVSRLNSLPLFEILHHRFNAPRNPLSHPTSGARVFSGCGYLAEGAGPVKTWVVHKEGAGVTGTARLYWRTEGVVVADATASEETEKGRGVEEGEAGIEEDEEEKEGRMKLGGGHSRRRLPPERRNREFLPSSACAGLVGLQGNSDLLTIPGVGPRNLKKLVDNGIGGVSDLKQLYKDKFFGECSPKMVEYLRGSVGNIHRNHAESITSFIKDTVDQDLKEENSHSNKKSAQKRITFCVEGNISVGKTTFLQRIANETLELHDLVEVVPEPISKWQDIGPDHFNILDAFYAEPQRYAYTFQNYVFVTRVMQERESAGGIKPLRLVERSIFSDRMVFVRAVHEANWMNEMEINIYDSWFDPVVSSLPGLIPDGFIYLRASPDTCHKRMMPRKRAEEGGLTMDYLRDLHEKHERWLFPFQSGNHGVLSVHQLPLRRDDSLHPDIRDRVFYLEGDHIHATIQKIPALVLDCEPNIDFNKDSKAKESYAHQISEFFEFVKKKQQVPSLKPGEEETAGSQQIVLPHKRDFWTPDKNPFYSSSLEPFDFQPVLSG